VKCGIQQTNVFVKSLSSVGERLKAMCGGAGTDGVVAHCLCLLATRRMVGGWHLCEKRQLAASETIARHVDSVFLPRRRVKRAVILPPV
jgi:hypothetical protein